MPQLEVDWESLRKQAPPKFVAVKKNTAEEDALDWELASLKGGQHQGHFGDMSGGHGAGHASPSGPQDLGTGNDAAKANAFMAEVAMHAIVTAENQAHGEW